MPKRTDAGDGRQPASSNTPETADQSASAAGSSRRSQKGKREGKDRAGAKERTRRVAEQARGQVNAFVVRQKDQVADRLGSLAGALRDTASKLQRDELGDFGRFAESAAERVDQLSSYLRDNDLRVFLRDTENFARRRPDVFLGGSFVAGLMLARFFKSSAPEQPGAGSPSARRRAAANPKRSRSVSAQRAPREGSVATGGTTPYSAPIGV